MTLYKLNSDGVNFQCWTIEVKNNKYRAITWKYGSEKKVTSKWTVVKGKNKGKKNETTDDEQAEKEAQAKVLAKLNSRYAPSLEEAKEKANVFMPLLAEKYVEQKDKLIFPVYVQPKLDGIRLLIDEERPFTRTAKGSPGGELFHCKFKERNIFSHNIVSDGEIYNHDYHDDFNTIVSLARTETYENDATAIEAEKKIEYWVYDTYFKDNPDFKFSERHEKLKEIFEGIEQVKIVETFLVHNEEELEAAYVKFLEAGYEGLMVRVDVPYEQKRSTSLLKYKPMETEEFELVGMLEGKGNRSKMMGKLVLMAKNGNTFEANMRGDFKLYRKLWKEREKLLGKMVTVKYQNLTPGKEVPRFGVALAIRDYE